MADEKSILVVGGGIAGITAALEAAEAGKDVILIERNTYLGGRVAQMYRYFPKLCPPSCGLEINFKRLKGNPRVRILTQTEVASVAGEAGDFTVELKSAPRFVNDKCTACGKCAEACELEVDNPFNYDMDKMKAAYLPHEHAFPAQFALHPDLVADADAAKKVADACEYGAIDLADAEKTEAFNVGAIVWATGWDPYDPAGLDYYGNGKFDDMITNVQMERLAAQEGPTGGKILRKNGEAPKHVVFVQCAGSRDEHHLGYCSGICCLASIKQASYVREQLPDAKVTICFIDIRCPDRLEEVYVKAQADEGIRFIKSKIADITQDEESGALVVNGEDTEKGVRFVEQADLVVLATGIVPNKPAFELGADDYGFLTAAQPAGHNPAGCVMKPNEVSSTVQDGTAAALRAIQTIVAR